MNELLVQGNRITGWLGRQSIDILRISLGLVFLAFGILKFFPGASPAEALVIRTIDTLTLGMISGQAALLLTAVMECFIGITLVTGKLLRTGCWCSGSRWSASCRRWCCSSGICSRGRPRWRRSTCSRTSCWPRPGW